MGILEDALGGRSAINYRLISSQKDEDERRRDPASLVVQALAGKLNFGALPGVQGARQFVENIPKENPLGAVLDVASRFNYASAGAAMEGVEAWKRGGPAELARSAYSGNIMGAAGAGFVGERRDTYSDVLEEAGLPEGPRVSIGPVSASLRDITGLALDIGLDPVTYASLGSGAAIKATGQAAAKAAIQEAAEKGLSKAAQQAAGRTAKEAAEAEAKQSHQWGGITLTPPLTRVRVPIAAFDPLSAVVKAADEVTSAIPGGTGVKGQIKDALGEAFAMDYKLKKAGYADLAEELGRIRRAPGVLRQEAEEMMARRFQGTTAEQRKLFFQAVESRRDLLDLDAEKAIAAARGVAGPTRPTTGDRAVDTLLAWYRKDYEPTLRQMKTQMGLTSYLDGYIRHYFPNRLPTGKAAPRPPQARQPGSFYERAGAPGYTEDAAVALAFDRAESLARRTVNSFLENTLALNGQRLRRGEAIPQGLVEYVHRRPGTNAAAAAGGTGAARYALPPEVAGALNTLTNPREVTGLLKAYDSVQNLWKASVTSIWPAFHARNMLGNFFNNWTAGVTSPAVYYDAAKIQSIADKAAYAVTRGGQLVKAGAADSIPLEVFTRELKLRGAVGTGFYGADLPAIGRGGLARIGGKLGADEAMQKALSRLDFAFQLRRGGIAIEENARLAHTLGRLRLGDTFDEAVQSTKRHLFSYDELSDLERGLFKRAIPFWTWTSRNIPLQVEKLIQEPRQAATIAKLSQFLESDASLTDAERAWFPTYITDRMGVAIGRDVDNRPIVLSGLGLPIEDINQLLSSTTQRTIGRWFQMMSPLLKMPIEAATGHSFFSGLPIESESFQNPLRDVYPFVADLPALRDWLNIQETKGIDKNGMETRYYDVDPWRMWALTSILGRAYFTTGKATDSRTEMHTKLLSVLTGVKVSTVDVQRAAASGLRPEFTAGQARLLDERNAKLQKAALAVQGADRQGSRETKVLARTQYRDMRSAAFRDAAIGIEALQAKDMAEQANQDPKKLAYADQLLPPLERALRSYHAIEPENYADDFGVPQWDEYFAAREDFLDSLPPAIKGQVKARQLAYIEKLPPEARRLEREYQAALTAYDQYQKLPPFGALVSAADLEKMRDLNRRYMAAGDPQNRATFLAALQVQDRQLLGKYFSIRTRPSPARVEFERKHPEMQLWGFVQ